MHQLTCMTTACSEMSSMCSASISITTHIPLLFTDKPITMTTQLVQQTKNKMDSLSSVVKVTN